LVGLVYGVESLGDAFRPVPIALFVYFLIPANVYLYGINDIFDADIDEHNPKKSDEGREVQYSGETAVTVVVLVCGLLGVAFVPFLPTEGLLGMVGFLLFGAAYSAPPLRLKTTPVLDSVSNGLYIMPAIGAFGAVAGALPPVEAVASGWVWTMAMHTFSAIPDIEPDREAGIETTATVLGGGWALTYCSWCWLFAAGAMALVHPLLGAVLFVYPLFAFAIVAFEVPIERAYWWFPIVNTLTGMVLTMGGLWRLMYA
jgi:4-hydroxybenzoate polyprenyltransferase